MDYFTCFNLHVFLQHKELTAVTHILLDGELALCNSLKGLSCSKQSGLKFNQLNS